MGKQRYWSGHGRATRKLKNEEQTHSSSSGSSSTDHEEASSTSAGCMCAVFQLFDFHPLNQNHHQQPQSSVSLSLKPISLPLDHHISTGTEAPRNSLESDEELPLPCTKQNDDLHIPKGIVQIRTRGRSRSKDSLNIDGDNFSGNSPGAKTPTLVARLMGLDLLPQSNSPSTTPRTTTSSSSVSPIYPLLQKPKLKTGSRSLPETPRTSCERKSNVENYHHRLSLQIPNYDKENNSTSPSHYAKEIVKQIKETVSRKSGLTDITNHQRRDHEVMMIQSSKPKKVSSSSCSLSPKLRVLEPKNNLNKLASPKVEAIKGSKKLKTKEVANKGNKQEEAFVVPSRITKAAIDGPRMKSKKTPLSNELLSFSSVPTVVKKKDAQFSSAKPPPMQSPGNRNQAAETVTGNKESKQVLQLSTNLHNNKQPHKTLHHHHVIQLPNNNNNKHHIIPAAAAADCGGSHHDITAEVDCVRKILITTQKEVSICHHYNAKLLCHLAEELLKPYVEERPWGGGGGCRRWPEVVEELCEKVRRYPRARCEVLEDIDGIIEKDMDRLGIGSFEDEWDGIVRRIEEDIVEELLKETVRFVDADGVV